MRDSTAFLSQNIVHGASLYLRCEHAKVRIGLFAACEWLWRLDVCDLSPVRYNPHEAVERSVSRREQAMNRQREARTRAHHPQRHTVRVRA